MSSKNKNNNDIDIFEQLEMSNIQQTNYPFATPNEEERKKFQEDRDAKKKEQIDYISNETILELSDTVKNVFIDVYGEDKDNIKLKSFIKDILLAYNPDFRDSVKKMDVPLANYVQEEQYKFQRKCSIQKSRWKKKAEEGLENRNKFALDVYKLKTGYDDIDESSYTKFKKNMLMALDSWTADGNMVDYPFFSSFTTKKSKLSALNYDIGAAALKSLLSALQKVIYRRPEYFATDYIWSKSYRKKEKVNLLKDKNDVLIEQNKNNTDITGERISLLDYISIADEEVAKNTNNVLDKLLSNFDKYKDSDMVKKMLKETLNYMSDFNKKDSAVFSYILSQISEQFYLTKEIHIIEKDALEALGKDPNQVRNREWFRATCRKLRLKQLPMMIKDGDNLTIDYPTLFQKISYKRVRKGGSKRSYNVIVLTASEDLHNLIIKQDTINVYNDDFKTLEKSNYPNSSLLIFQLQILRIQLYNNGKTKAKIPKESLAKYLDLEDLNGIEQISEISHCLEAYKHSEVFIKSYNYCNEYDEYEIEMIPFNNKDLALLVNSRKDYSKIAHSHFGMVAIE